jgi:YfiR/HmsC-like
VYRHPIFEFQNCHNNEKSNLSDNPLMIKYIPIKPFSWLFTIQLVKKYYNKMSMNFLNLLIIAILGVSTIKNPYTPVSVVAREYQIKAVFVFNFTKGFITWPSSVFANEEEPFHICILGEDPFNGLLDTTVQGKVARNGRSLVIDRVENINAISSCHILFIEKSQQDSLTQIRQVAKRYSILTVSDMEGFTENQGGMIEFFTLEKNIKVAVNICVLEQAQLKATADLLKLSKITRECPD